MYFIMQNSRSLKEAFDFVRDGVGEGEGGWGSTDMLLSSLVELLFLNF